MWKKVTSKEIFSHARLSLVEDEVLLPNGYKTTYLKYKDDGSSIVNIICINSDGKILISKEYAYPSDTKLYQLPGGITNFGEDIIVGANRELMEETGYMAGRLVLLGKYLYENRRSEKMCYTYLATDLKEKKLEHDQEEEIENMWVSESSINKMIKNGEILNCHMLASWSLYKASKNKQKIRK